MSAGDTATAQPAATSDQDPPGRPVRRVTAWAALGGTASAILLADALTKQLAVSALEGKPAVRLLGGAVYLVLVRNSGAAFSLGRSHTLIFPLLTLGAVCWIGWMAARLRSVPWGIALGLVLGGALGNLGDRVFRAPGPFVGHVVDFVSLFSDDGHVWPVFNLADSCLFAGLGLALLLEMTGRRRDGTRVRVRRT